MGGYPMEILLTLDEAIAEVEREMRCSWCGVPRADEKGDCYRCGGSA
jgi:hypothetical protein